MVWLCYSLLGVMCLGLVLVSVVGGNIFICVGVYVNLYKIEIMCVVC